MTMQPAPGTNPNMPTAPLTQVETTPAPAVAEPAQAPAVDNAPTTTPVNAQSATSDAAQAAATPAPTTALELPDATPAAAPTGEAYVHTATGNATVDQVGSLLAEKSVAGAADIIKEITTGELSLTSKVALTDAFGEGVANMIVNSVTTEATAASARGAAEGTRLKEVAQKLFNSPDAEKTWEGLQKFAASEDSGLTAQDRATLNEMLKEGGVKGDMAVKELSNRFMQSQGYSQEADLLQGDLTPTAQFEPLSKVDYVQQMSEVVAKYGEQSREAEALRNRRLQSMKRGL